MVNISIEGSSAIFAVQGLHKLLAFKARVAVPLAHVSDVRLAEPDDLRGWWKALRLPGTHVPGLLIAGTFYRDGKRVFCDVGNSARAIIVELAGERYDQLIVEVANPLAEVARFQAAPLG